MRLGLINSASIIILGVGALATNMVARDAVNRLRNLEVRARALEFAADSASNVGIANARAIHDLGNRLDAATKAAHERRAALADELRREAVAAIAPLSSALAGLSARLDDETGVRELIGESLYQGLDGLRIKFRILDERLDGLERRRPEPARTETVKVVERVVEKPIYVQPIYYYLAPLPVCR